MSLAMIHNLLRYRDSVVPRRSQNVANRRPGDRRIAFLKCLIPYGRPPADYKSVLVEHFVKQSV